MSAVTYAAAHTGEPFPTDTCLMQVRRAFKIYAYPDSFTGARTAYNAWLYAGGAMGQNTHTMLDAPANVPIFFKGRGAAGHIAISAGNGMCWSTDIRRPGHWDLVSVKSLSAKWNMKYLGWSETLLGIRVHPHVKYVNGVARAA